MATSETRMGSTCPTNEKGIKRKVDRSWIVRKRERYIEIENMFTSDGVWKICDASNKRWVKRKMQLRVRKRTKQSGKRKSSESKMKRSGGERKAEEVDSPRWTGLPNHARIVLSLFSILRRPTQEDNYFTMFPYVIQQFPLHSSHFTPFVISPLDDKTIQSIVRVCAATEIKARDSFCDFVSNRCTERLLE